jgi:hypothetical protein
MAHSSKFIVDGQKYVVVHNGDWSGMAEILYEVMDGDVAVTRHDRLPGKLLRLIGRQAAINEMISKLEDLMEVEV